MIEPQALQAGVGMPIATDDFNDLLEGDQTQLFDASPDLTAPVQTFAEAEAEAELQLPVPAGTIVGADDRVSRQDLVDLLEGFVNVLKADNVSGTTGEAAAREFSVAIVNAPRAEDAQVNDRTSEIESLRNLVIEAQDTIIKLLTDRVEDRAKIATLQTQVNLLPDLQQQADRAMAAATRTEEYKTELTKIKFEMDRFKLFRVRAEEEASASLWTRIKRFFIR